jgi:hypothetical protein
MPDPGLETILIFRSFGPMAKAYVQTSDELDALAARRHEIMKELEEIRKQEEAICHDAGGRDAALAIDQLTVAYLSSKGFQAFLSAMPGAAHEP